MQLNLCSDAVPAILGILDLNVAPALLLYSYIPILLVNVLLAGLLVWKGAGELLHRLLFGILLSFALWIVIILFQWTGAHCEVVHLAWQLLLIPELGIYVFSVLFAFAFIFQRSYIPRSIAGAAGTLFVLAALLLPTTLNISVFDTEYCQGVVGILWSVLYILEWVLLSLVILFAIVRLRTKISRQQRAQTVLLTVGIVFFLGIFWASNYFGELTQTYEINLIGPVGMVLFLGMLAYLVVRFQILHMQLFATQVFVIALLFLVAALLFIQRLEYIHSVVICTLALVGVLGYQLIHSVKREIQQRERLEKLAHDLETANDALQEEDRQKDELLSLVSHQLATPISSLKWYLEMLLDGDLGNVSTEQKEHLQTMTQIGTNLSDLVSMILDVSRIQLGRIQIEKTELDLEQFFTEICHEVQPKAMEKHLKLDVHLLSTWPKAQLDRRYTRMTIENLLTNAIKYTPEKGTVRCSVMVQNGILRCEVQDTGCGIPIADQKQIFGRLFRASNVRNTVNGNGFGLYIAKGAVEAQGGRIGFKSSEGKGTTFWVELPLT